MSQNHPYHDFALPENVSFELKPSPGKGWGSFATKPIQRGDLILREKFLFVIQKPYAAIMEQDVWMAFYRLGPDEKQQFLCLRDNSTKPFEYMKEAFDQNSFSIYPQSYGLALLHSRFNHSCVPNCFVPESRSEIIVSYAARNIAVGEEITFCYNDNFECLTGRERHEELEFVCDCKACLPGTPYQQLSDMRRKLIRGLQYLSVGHDLNVQTQVSTAPLIFDPKLKKAAEDFSIPISLRLIHGLLIACLVEAEGLLNELMTKRLDAPVLFIASCFMTMSNTNIVRLAMAQPTWVGKFVIALRLYGRKDIADDRVNMELRTREILAQTLGGM